MSSGRGCRRDGSLLVMTLWVVVILGLLAVSVGRQMAIEIRLARYRASLAQAKALARSGAYLAIARLAADETEHDALGDDWARAREPLGPEDFRARVTGVTDLERKLNLNLLSDTMLEALLGSPEAAARVRDYLDEPDPIEQDPDAEPPYVPKDGPMTDVAELDDIPGLAPEALAALRALTAVTPDPAAPAAVNINTAEREVLLAIAGPELGGEAAQGVIEALMAARPGPDGEFGTPDDCVVTDMVEAPATLEACTRRPQTLFIELLSKGVFGVRSELFLVEAEGEAGRPGARHRVRALVRRGVPGEWPAVLAWEEGG
ncbi:MAG TPA: hypothetical protein VGB20_01340 [bacterium]